MLILTREVSQRVTIGSERMIHEELSPRDRQALIDNKDPALFDLVKRLLEAEPGLIEITLTDIRGDRCRLGITAPKDVPVHRREVYDALRHGAQVGESVRVGADRADPYVAGSGQRSPR